MESKEEFELELLCLDKAVPLATFLDYCALANTSLVKRLCLQSGLLHMIPEATDSLELACQVSYPDGLASRSAKVFEANYAINSGCKIVDLVINNVDLINGKWDKINGECKEISELCKEKGVGFRVVCEYRLQAPAIMKTFFTMMCNIECDGIITATGRMPDDPTENLLFCHHIAGTIPIRLTACGHIFSSAQVHKFLKLGVDSFRITSLNTAKSLLDIS